MNCAKDALLIVREATLTSCHKVLCNDNYSCWCLQASDQGVTPGAGQLAAAEAADANKLPMIEIRNPTLYSLLPREEVTTSV